ncbi:alpha/beta fold hydrolase [Sphingomonas sp. HDW15A]|uniref:alpha/beta fold hydrolase n=1 Tax=Sphingomonas sp. HDW15A TaxID=2714942 RepID=UPI00140941C9|nr:alpha/beta fold hydrolase [Sphingomonas sp. HDW15A]QIK95182.1 alpha/beta fold hydrolase [Sphingomonas sp. HDW15A]
MVAKSAIGVIIGAMGALATALGRIGVEERGSGPLTPIVFLHGVGSDKSVWNPQLAHFGQSRRAVALDYPGYGESDFLASATRDDFARAALAVLDALDIDSAHVCGLSLGGVVAIAMHALAPQRCRSLILADTFADHPDGAAIFERSIEASRSMGMRPLAEARAGALLGSQAGEDIRSEVVETMSRIDPAAYAIGAEAVWLAKQSYRAAAIAVPALVMVGSEDRITPPELSQELAAMVEGATLQTIAEAGHLTNLERPVEFNRAVADFLNRVEHSD